MRHSHTDPMEISAWRSKLEPKRGSCHISLETKNCGSAMQASNFKPFPLKDGNFTSEYLGRMGVDLMICKASCRILLEICYTHSSSGILVA
jgi:hypothetical protein